MKVSELIKALQNMPQDLEVYTELREGIEKVSEPFSVLLTKELIWGECELTYAKNDSPKDAVFQAIMV